MISFYLISILFILLNKKTSVLSQQGGIASSLKKKIMVLFYSSKLYKSFLLLQVKIKKTPGAISTAGVKMFRLDETHITSGLDIINLVFYSSWWLQIVVVMLRGSFMSDLLLSERNLFFLLFDIWLLLMRRQNYLIEDFEKCISFIFKI